MSGRIRFFCVIYRICVLYVCYLSRDEKGKSFHELHSKQYLKETTCLVIGWFRYFSVFLESLLNHVEQRNLSFLIMNSFLHIQGDSRWRIIQIQRFNNYSIVGDQTAAPKKRHKLSIRAVVKEESAADILNASSPQTPQSGIKTAPPYPTPASAPPLTTPPIMFKIWTPSFHVSETSCLFTLP